MESRFNIPGKIAWATMEAPGFMMVLYLMFTLPQRNGITQLPGPNWLMAALFVCETGSVTGYQVATDGNALRLSTISTVR